MSYTIVGVIGHIDHGKTSLVAALTGVDTDTHPEEKRRGITIDLGFASFCESDHEFALIDAPGHQKYIGNLLAGVSSVDIGLLVVACDQGIQEQTLEHASILQNLGIEKIVVAVSRIDLSDQETLDELTEELQVFLTDYGFTEIPVIPISSVTGEGLDSLKHQLVSFARTNPRNDQGPFRLPIDRVFSVEGRGCVVAGTPWSGIVSVGDILAVASTGQEIRVREMETHGAVVDQSRIGRRTAMNITGISANDLRRGDELVAADTYRATSQHIVQIRSFRSAPELRCPTTVQIHTATTSCTARITGVRTIGPSEQLVAVIESESPLVTEFGQQFLLRLPYPVGSFASGKFLASLHAAQTRKRDLVDLGQKLVDAKGADRLVAWVDYWGEIKIEPARIELTLGIPKSDLKEIAQAAIECKRLIQPSESQLISTRSVQRARDYATKLLNQQAETEDAWMVEESLGQKMSTVGSNVVAKIAVDSLVEESVLVRLNRMVAIASDDTTLSKKQRARMQQIIGLYADNRTPPTIKEVATEIGATVDAISSPVRFATQQRILTDLGGGFLFSSDVFGQLCEELTEMFAKQPELSASEIKEHWKVTRKHAIPLLEHCDKLGITSRKGSVRTIGPNATTSQV